MAKNGTLQNSYRGYTYRMYWSATQSIANNTSTVLIDHWLDCGSSWDLYVGSRPINCSVGSDAKSINANAVSTGGGASIKLGTTSHTVRHNDDGSLTVNIRSSYGMQATIAGTWVGSIDVNGSITLDDIPRKATITSWPSEWTDEQEPVIKYSNPAGNAVTSLGVCVALDGKTAYTSYYDLPKTGKEQSITWNATDLEKLQQAVLNNSVSREGVQFCVRTVIGEETYYDWSKSTTLTIANCEPTLNPTATDTNSKTVALTGDPNKVVRYQSIVSVDSGAKALKHASIKTQSVICGNYTLNAGSGQITNPQSNLFKFVVSDNRGQTVPKEKLLGLVEYVNLTCSQSVRINLDSAGPTETSAIAELTISGSYFNGDFGKSNNTLELEYRYKEVTNPETPWSTLNEDGWRSVDDTITKSNNKYSVVIEIPGLYQDKRYIFQCRATDAIYTGEGVTTKEYTVQTRPVFDWGYNDFNFNVPVMFNGGITAINITAGTDLNSMTIPGLYRCWYSSTAESLLNCPTDRAFILEVLPNHEITQRITEFTSVQTPRVFMRNLYMDSWGKWYEYVLHQNEIGTSTDLLSTTYVNTDGTSKNTSYTFPSDGYLVLRASYRTGSYVNAVLCGANGAGFNVTATSGSSVGLQGNPTETIFVRKGMLVKNMATSSDRTGNDLRFYPLT